MAISYNWLLTYWIIHETIFMGRLGSKTGITRAITVGNSWLMDVNIPRNLKRWFQKFWPVPK